MKPYFVSPAGGVGLLRKKQMLCTIFVMPYFVSPAGGVGLLRKKQMLCTIFVMPYFVSPAGGVGLLRKKQMLCTVIDAYRFILTQSTYLMVCFDSSLASEGVREVDRWMGGFKESEVEECLEVGSPSARDAKYKPRVDALLAR